MASMHLVWEGRAAEKGRSEVKYVNGGPARGFRVYGNPATRGLKHPGSRHSPEEGPLELRRGKQWGSRRSYAGYPIRPWVKA
jgi:hypothetical protein